VDYLFIDGGLPGLRKVDVNDVEMKLASEHVKGENSKRRAAYKEIGSLRDVADICHECVYIWGESMS
jgi:hypothetical protein